MTLIGNQAGKGIAIISCRDSLISDSVSSNPWPSITCIECPEQQRLQPVCTPIRFKSHASTPIKYSLGERGISTYPWLLLRVAHMSGVRHECLPTSAFELVRTRVNSFSSSLPHRTGPYVNLRVFFFLPLLNRFWRVLQDGTLIGTASYSRFVRREQFKRKTDFFRDICAVFVIYIIPSCDIMTMLVRLLVFILRRHARALNSTQVYFGLYLMETNPKRVTDNTYTRRMPTLQTPSAAASYKQDKITAPTTVYMCDVVICIQ